jgi:hypothetical protein
MLDMSAISVNKSFKIDKATTVGNLCGRFGLIYGVEGLRCAWWRFGRGGLADRDSKRCVVACKNAGVRLVVSASRPLEHTEPSNFLLYLECFSDGVWLEFDVNLLAFVVGIDST